MDEWWIEPMRTAFAGRRMVLAGSVAAAWTEYVALLRSVGVTDMLVVATEGRGAGPIPDVETIVVEPPSHLSTMEQIRFGDRTLADPPADVIGAVRRFDPDRDALVLGTFLNTSTELDGRPFVSARRPEWVALEDKVVVDAFWDRAGVARQESTVVAVDDAPVVAPTLDRGAGTVWAADARDGFHGGASSTYWVGDDTTADRALAALRPVCDHVRVMPYLEGIPCSIHGIVLPDGVIVLRPVEMIVLRRGHEFVYAGCATYWDPAPATRAQMIDIARRAGAQLRSEVAFRGTFTVDGVATSEGFWPTELNPRFGGGIMTIARAAGIPILPVNDLIVAGHDLGRSATELEQDLVAHADQQRGGGTWMGGLAVDVELAARPVGHGTDGRWTWAHDDRSPAGHVTAGSGFVRCVYEPSETPRGPSTARLAAGFWAFVDREFDARIGVLTPPPDPAVSVLRHGSDP